VNVENRGGNLLSGSNQKANPEFEIGRAESPKVLLSHHENSDNCFGRPFGAGFLSSLSFHFSQSPRYAVKVVPSKNLRVSTLTARGSIRSSRGRRKKKSFRLP
jgi:hypothetical protein